MKAKQPVNIYQSRKGITLTEGYFLARNPRTKLVSVISITGDTVLIHDITRQMPLQNFVNMDASGYLEVFDALKRTEIEKEKNKSKK